MNPFLKLIIFIAIDIYIFKSFGKIYGFLGLGIIIYRFLNNIGFLRSPKIYRGAFNEGVVYLKDYLVPLLVFITIDLTNSLMPNIEVRLVFIAKILDSLIQFRKSLRIIAKRIIIIQLNFQQLVRYIVAGNTLIISRC